MPITPMLNENGHPLHASHVCWDNKPLVSGLSKREHFCLKMGVPKTGDYNLDKIIIEGNKIKLAGLAMQGLCHAIDSQGTWAHESETVADAAVAYADALLAELDKSE
mgnify:CR=1 FL=1